MFGWLRRPSARASRRMRAMYSGSPCGGRVQHLGHEFPLQARVFDQENVRRAADAELSDQLVASAVEQFGRGHAAPLAGLERRAETHAELAWAGRERPARTVRFGRVVELSVFVGRGARDEQDHARDEQRAADADADRADRVVALLLGVGVVNAANVPSRYGWQVVSYVGDIVSHGVAGLLGFGCPKWPCRSCAGRCRRPSDPRSVTDEPVRAGAGDQGSRADADPAKVRWKAQARVVARARLGRGHELHGEHLTFDSADGDGVFVRHEARAFEPHAVRPLRQANRSGVGSDVIVVDETGPRRGPLQIERKERAVARERFLIDAGSSVDVAGRAFSQVDLLFGGQIARPPQLDRVVPGIDRERRRERRFPADFPSIKMSAASKR